MTNRHNMTRMGQVAVAGALALAVFGTASAQSQPGYGPGGMLGRTTQAESLNSLDDAKQAFQRYIDATGFADLALDEVVHFQWNYYAIVKEQSTGNVAFELLADPRSGVVFPEMGPNMMWNTKYSPMATLGGGMMGGFGGFAPRGMMSGTWGPTGPGQVWCHTWHGAFLASSEV